MDALCGASDDVATKTNDVMSDDFSDSDLLLQRFYHHVDKRGDAPYLHQPVGNDKVETYTFKDVFDQAYKMYKHLESLGCPPQSKIAIISKNCAHFWMAELAIWMAGHVTVALFPTLAAKSVEYIFDHSESKLLFVGKLDDNWPETEKGVPDGIPKIAFPLAPEGGDYEKWDDVVAKVDVGSDEKSRPTRGVDDESLIVYTSGSTGKPKGVLHTFRTISEPTKRMVALNDITPEDRYLSYLPIAHVLDRFLALCCSLYAGGQVYFAETLQTFLADLQRCRPTLFMSVPRLWLKFQLGVYAKMPEWKLNMLLSIPLVGRAIGKKVLKGLGLEHVRLAGSGSAPIPADLIRWYRSLGLELMEGYGMSENFCYSHTSLPGRARLGYVGEPFPGVQCKLSEEGEILVKSPGTMVGYYKAPELTSEVMTDDGYLKTGDRGSIDKMNRLKITGRVKELFKTSKGKYVAPAPIENILNNDSNIELSLVGGSGQVTTMAIVQLAEELRPKLKDDSAKNKIEEELKSLLESTNKQIEEYERIGFIVVAKEPWTVENELLTPTLKIKRTAIENAYEGKLDGWYASKKKVIWEE